MLRPGRPTRVREIEIGEIRELTPEDIATLREPRPRVPAAQRFRDSHHMMARLFASGLKATAVASRCGYSLTRVTILHNDPAFLELIAHYRQMVDESFVENVDAYIELATSNMMAAERHISDKIAELDEEGELLSVREAVAISRDAADRLGYGKKQTNLNVNIDFAARLDKAIKRSGKIIDSAAILPTQPAQGVSTSPSQPALAPPLRRRIA